MIIKVKLQCVVQYNGKLVHVVYFLVILLYLIIFDIFQGLGTYVIMMRVIAIRFLFFLPVFLVFIIAFELTFYMLFQNFDNFHNVAIGFAKTGFVRNYFFS